MQSYYHQVRQAPVLGLEVGTVRQPVQRRGDPDPCDPVVGEVQHRLPTPPAVVVHPIDIQCGHLGNKLKHLKDTEQLL